MKRLTHLQYITLLFSCSAFGASFAPPSDIVIDLFGVPLKVLVGALAGGVCALSFLPPMPSRVSMFTSVLLGFCAATYGAPLLAEYFSKQNLLVGIAFFSGLFAHPILSWAFNEVPAFLKRKFGSAS